MTMIVGGARGGGKRMAMARKLSDVVQDIRCEQIICAVCNKFVDRISTTYDPFLRIRYIRVECHGATEDVELTDMMLVDCNSFQFGKAFQKQAESERIARFQLEAELDQRAIECKRS